MSIHNMTGIKCKKKFTCGFPECKDLKRQVTVALFERR